MLVILNQFHVITYSERTVSVLLQRTIFFVLSFAFSDSKICKSSTFVTRNNATYNWSWEKAESRKSTSTIFKNWFCDLFTIIAKHKRIENCFRWTIQNKSFEKLLITIFEINRICSFLLSLKIRIFKTNLRMFVTIKRMSLQKFFLKHKFCNNMIEILTFNRKMSKNSEKIFKNRKCSIKISSIRNSSANLKIDENFKVWRIRRPLRL